MVRKIRKEVVNLKMFIEVRREMGRGEAGYENVSGGNWGKLEGVRLG